MQTRKNTEVRWDVIQSALTRRIDSIDDLVAAILEYNLDFKEKWKFDGLRRLIEEVIDSRMSLVFRKKKWFE